MRINDGFELREMCGEHIIIGTGTTNIDFSKVISLNESAVYLWREIEGKEFTLEMLASLLTEQYEVPYETALSDTTVLVNKWLEVGIVSN